MSRTIYIYVLTAVLLSSCVQVGQQALVPEFTSTPAGTPTSTLTSTPDQLPNQSPTVPTFSAPTANPFFVAKLGTVESNVTYCTMGLYPLLMDIYYPTSGDGPWPVVINIHGGAWSLNSKLNGWGLMSQPVLNARGFLMVSVDYRLAPGWHWPAMIEDVKCAVRSLRAHALEYNLDPDRIGVVGDSVGGQFALLLALTDRSAGWDVGEYLGYSSQVQAVVDYFGPTDLTDRSIFPLISSWGQRAFWNTSWNSPDLIDASPISYVKKDTPPILIVQGDMDHTVRLVQSQRFYDQMKAVGAPVTLLIVKNAVHSFADVYHQDPTTDVINIVVSNYFSTKLARWGDPSLLQCPKRMDDQPPDLSDPACLRHPR